jgi:hypothetical protein
LYVLLFFCSLKNKRKEGHTIQWLKEQKTRRTYNTMAKRQKDKKTNNTMA